MKLVIVSGEPLRHELIQDMRAKLPTTKLVNLLSTTEFGDVMSCLITDEVVASMAKNELTVAPVGNPLWNVDLEIIPMCECGDCNTCSSQGDGELCIGGHGIVEGHEGYYMEPEITSRYFKASCPGGKILWWTKDAVRRIGSRLTLVGRLDSAVKIRGYKVDMEGVAKEINNALVRFSFKDDPRRCFLRICGAHCSLAHINGTEKLCALIQIKWEDSAMRYELDAEDADFINGPIPETALDGVDVLRSLLGKILPDAQVPKNFTLCWQFPLTQTGKLNGHKCIELHQSKKRLHPEPTGRGRGKYHALSNPRSTPSSAVANKAEDIDSINVVRRVWSDILGEDLTGVHPDTSFFDIGGNSLHVARLARKLGIKVTDIFAQVTARGMADLQETTVDVVPRPVTTRRSSTVRPIAVVGMAVRWPGTDDAQKCASLAEAWQTLKNGSTATTTFGPPRDASHVPRGVVLPAEAVNTFDAEFWGIHPKKAELIDPNHRIFLELCYEALVNGGYLPRTKRASSAGSHRMQQRACPANVGVFSSSASLPTYLTEVLGNNGQDWLLDLRNEDPAKYWELELGNDKDYIATRASYFLNLQGPSKNVQSACSSGLLCVAEGVEAIRSGQCEAALCGAISIFFPQNTGHKYVPGMVWSKDGFCRSFDAEASGMMNANAGACFMLKPVDRLTPEDFVYGVIKGVGVSNDGREKASFDAPSEKGQIDAILRAHSECPGYLPEMLEAHGTGTRLGDPIEIEAFRQAMDKLGYLDKFTKPVSISAVKSNIGHANTAAGAMGFLSLLLQLHHQEKAPLATLKTPNPALNLGTNLKLQQTAEEWVNGKGAISSLGVGGTNVHVLCESAHHTRSLSNATKQNSCHMPLLLLSGASPDLVSEMRDQLEAFAPEDMAYTLAFGRPHLRYRMATTALHRITPIVESVDKNIPVVFLFPGQGSQYPNMANSLYNNPRFPVFTESVDKCARILGWNPLVPFIGRTNEQTQLGIFILELALANLLIEQFGIIPSKLLGHSLGEYACATICGVFSLPQALDIVALRGQLLDKLQGEPSEMLSVAVSEETLGELPPGVVVCCRNAPDRLVLGGLTKDIHHMHKMLKERGISSARLKTSAAFHTKAVRPLEADMLNKLRTLTLHKPTWPMVSSVTGTIAHEDEVTTPEYWVRQMLHPVEFSAALHTCIGGDPNTLCMEVGPNQALSQLAKYNKVSVPAIPTMMRPKGVFIDGEDVLEGPCESVPFLLEAIGLAWARGASIDLSRDMEVTGARGRVVPLPPVLWNRQPCWSSPLAPTINVTQKARPAARSGPTRSLFHRLTWTPAPRPNATTMDDFVPCVALDRGTTPMPLDAMASFIPLEDVGAYATKYGVCAILGMREEDEDPEGQIVLVEQLIRVFQAIHDLRSTIVIIRADTARYQGVAAFCRAAQKERPDLHLRIVHLDTSDAVMSIARQEMLANDHEVRVHYARGTRAVSTLHYVEPSADVKARAVEGRFSGDRWVIITGGTSGIGCEVALWARARGAKVCILARNSRALDGADVDAHVCLCDISDKRSVDTVIASLGGMDAVEAVFHCAGVVADRTIGSMTPTKDFILPLVKAKIHGAKNIVNAVADSPHVRVVLFSSSSATLGIAGQALYCFANQYMDALCDTRPNCVAIQWGGWTVGMTLTHDIKPLSGEAFLGVDAGMEALAVVHEEMGENVLVMDVEHIGTYVDSIAVAEGLVSPLVAAGLPTLPGTLDFTSLPSAGLSFLRDHQFEGRMVVPGTFWLEVFTMLCASLVKGPIVLHDVEFLRPYDASGSVSVHATRIGDDWLFEVKNNEEVIACARSRVTVHTDMYILRTRWSETLARLDIMDGAAARNLYHEFSDAGFEYGPRFKLLSALWKGDDVVAATVCAEASTVHWELGTSAATVDACTHVASLVHDAGFGGLPRRIKRVEVSMHAATGDDGEPRLWNTVENGQWRVLCARSKVHSDATAGMAVDLVLLGAQCCITMEGFDMEPWVRMDDVFAVAWTPLEPTSPTSSPLPATEGPWLVVGSDAWSHELAALLKDNARHISTVKDYSDVNSTISGIVLREGEHLRACEKLVTDVGARPNLRHGGARLWVCPQVARDGVHCLHSVVDCDDSASSVGAFAELLVAPSEHAWVRIVDGAVSSPSLTPAELRASMNSATASTISTPRDNGRSTSQQSVKRSGDGASENVYKVVPDLASKTIGTVVVPTVRAEVIGADEVEICTEVWGLNFLDVMQAKGVIDLGDEVSLGGETVGSIARIGASVTRFAPGDRVAALTWGGWGTYCVVPADFVVKIPAALDAASCATINLCYATAWLAAVWLARVEEGESMLVHSGAGGVGMAALAIGKMKGASPLYATCSNNAAKHAALHSWGVPQGHIFNSHDVADYVSAIDERGGVDVVLSSLAGAAMQRSIHLVNPFGRFVEIGKRDQFSDTPIGLQPFAKGIQYMSAHLDVLMRHYPRRVAKLLEEVWHAVENGTIPVLPVQVFHGFENGHVALEALSNGTHVGKIVVMNNPSSIPKTLAEPSRRLLIVVQDGVDIRWAQEIGEQWALTWSTQPTLAIARTVPASSSDCILFVGSSIPEGLPDAVKAIVHLGAATTLRPPCAFVEVSAKVDPALVAKCLASESRFLMIGNRLRFPKPERKALHSNAWTAEKLEAWLVEKVNVDPLTPGGFEAFGIDSLGKLQLMNALHRSGCPVSLVDLEGDGCLRDIAQKICGPTETKSESKSKVLCLHGFRTNADIFRYQLFDFPQDEYSLVFVDAPFRASGPPQAELEEAGLKSDADNIFKEWWRCPSTKDDNGVIPLGTGWDQADCEGLDESLSLLEKVIREQGPFTGIVGFSQGGAMAHILASRGYFKWAVLFSPVICRDARADFSTTSHYPAMIIFDPDEPVQDHCHQIHAITGGAVIEHQRGHYVPKRNSDEEVYAQLNTFVQTKT
eukprot:GEMP01000061.1.p1 GENE.GEMP01000061.1~~GEMP01000061.1.p1  ORF type:complete len:3378 (+),score=868.45 GEMP01000061.1:1322-10135(+)